MTDMSKIDASWAAKWVAAWNSHDIEAVLDHYVNDCRFVSPKAAAIAGKPTIEGKDALRAYWSKALEKFPALRFELRHAVFDEKEKTIAIVYECSLDPATTPAVLACEVLSFGDSDRAVRGEAFYGATL